MKLLHIQTSIALLLLGCVSVSAQVSDNGDGTFSNPVIFADVPDPSVIRVDDTFYMVSTTMHMAPGCTIMKSHDLVNWHVVNYTYTRLEDTDAFSLKNGQNDYADGSWAANLRYDKYEGRFYVIVTCNSTNRSYIFTTKDIENGPWRRNVVDKCYDPGLLFEDTGTECKKYVVHPSDDLGKHETYLRELHANSNGDVTLGEAKVIIDHANLENPAEGLRAEGYHGYKIGNYYYIFMIQGAGWGRQEIVWRSKTLEHGTFEARRIFTGHMVNKDGENVLPSSGIAQGGIVDMPDGRWYALLFQDYGSVGRTPVLIPMKWENGWPVLGNNGMSVDHIQPKPVQGFEPCGIVVSDEFNNGTVRKFIQEGDEDIIVADTCEYGYNGSNLKMEWQWNHNPDNNLWSLTERDGYLRLKSGHIAKNIQEARNTLTQRTFGPQCSANVELEVEHMHDGDVAGLAAFQNQYGFVGVKMEGGNKYLIMQRAREKGDAEGQEIERLPLQQDRVYLRVDCDFSGMTDKADFYCSTDGTTWNRIGDTLQMHYDWPHFVGYRFGLFYYSTEQIGGHVDFDYFHVNK